MWFISEAFNRQKLIKIVGLLFIIKVDKLKIVVRIGKFNQ